MECDSLAVDGQQAMVEGYDTMGVATELAQVLWTAESAGSVYCFVDRCKAPSKAECGWAQRGW
jgi:hypothetical protein